VIVILYESYQLPFRITGLSKDTSERVSITLAQQVTFLNKATILKALDSIPEGSTVEIDCSQTIFVHPDVVEIIDNFELAATSKDIEATVINLDHHKQTPSAGMRVAVPTHNFGNHVGKS